MKTLLLPLFLLSFVSNKNAREYDLRFIVSTDDCSSDNPAYFLFRHQLVETYRTELDLYNWAYSVPDGYTWVWEKSPKIRCNGTVYFRCPQTFKLEIVPAWSFKKFNRNTTFRVNIFIYGHDIGFVTLEYNRPRMVNLRPPL